MLACRIRLEVFHGVSAFPRLRQAWDELAARSEDDEPMASPLWLGAWWQTFGGHGGRRLDVYTFWEGERLVGLIPLVARIHLHPPGIPYRRLELCGSGEDEADEICSDYLGLLAERGWEERVARALVAALAGTWDELVLPSMRGDSPSTRALERALLAERIEADRTRSCPYIPLPSTWDAYLKALSSQNRYMVTRSLRDFDAWAPGTLHVASDAASLAEGSRVLRSLHSERWQAKGQGGVFASARFDSFHRQVMPAMLARGALDLLWLTARGEPVAAVYSVVWRGRTLFYQGGRRMDLPPKLRPGIVLHAHAIRRAIELGRREYDFLAGESRYKQQLALASRPLLTLRAVRAPLREAARRVARQAVTWWRDRMAR